MKFFYEIMILRKGDSVMIGTDIYKIMDAWENKDTGTVICGEHGDTQCDEILLYCKGKPSIRIRKL